jgi:hypothetical protein
MMMTNEFRPRMSPRVVITIVAEVFPVFMHCTYIHTDIVYGNGTMVNHAIKDAYTTHALQSMYISV